MLCYDHSFIEEKCACVCECVWRLRPVYFQLHHRHDPSTASHQVWTNPGTLTVLRSKLTQTFLRSNISGLNVWHHQFITSITWRSDTLDCFLLSRGRHHPSSHRWCVTPACQGPESWALFVQRNEIWVRPVTVLNIRFAHCTVVIYDSEPQNFLTRLLSSTNIL